MQLGKIYTRYTLQRLYFNFSLFDIESSGSLVHLPAMDDPREHGNQPLDTMMESWKLTNHELVEISTEQLNHKQVQKARKGRQLTLPMMQKVMALVQMVRLKLR